MMMNTLPPVKSLPSNDIKKNCLSFYATLATNRTISRSLLHKRKSNTFTITDIIGTIVSPRKWGWKAELMTVRKHAINKLPYVNSERSLSKDTVSMNAGFTLGFALQFEPEAALWNWAAVPWASKGTDVDGSKWKNGGTWTPTGGVLLQPLLSFRRACSVYWCSKKLTKKIFLERCTC